MTVVAGALAVGDVLDALAERLGGASGLPARQEARDLIAAVLDVARFWPSAHREHVLAAADRAAIEDAAARLQRGMPFAYAVRRATFRTHALYVDERVLIPRPETEVLVDIVLAAAPKHGGTVVDVGTGSGCIAVALATEGRFARIIATDISHDALAVARRNADGRAPVELRAGSYLAPCTRGEADVVVANPPYISWHEANDLPSLVRDWEPPLALFAEDDGMAAIRAIADDGGRVLNAGGLLALEVDTRRAARAAALVSSMAAYRDVVVKPDLTGRARFVLARRVEA